MTSKCGGVSLNQCSFSHFNVFCDLLLNRRKAMWNLFVLLIDYNEETNYKKSFNITWKPASEWPLWQTQKTYNTLLSIQNDAISLVAMHSKTIVIGPRKPCHCQLGSSRATRGMKTYSKRSQFLSSELKSLDVCLEYCRSLKKYTEKTWSCSQHWRPFEFWLFTASWDWLSIFFWVIFQNRNSFFFLLLVHVPVQCLDKTFLDLIFLPVS